MKETAQSFRKEGERRWGGKEFRAVTFNALHRIQTDQRLMKSFDLTTGPRLRDY